MAVARGAVAENSVLVQFLCCGARNFFAAGGPPHGRGGRALQGDRRSAPGPWESSRCREKNIAVETPGTLCSCGSCREHSVAMDRVPVTVHAFFCLWKLQENNNSRTRVV